MLNKQKGNMYGFVTHTWNPIKGKCSHDCRYCYMKVWKQKPLRLVEKELQDDLGEENFIFVGSSTDMFAKDVPDEWIKKVLDHCKKYPENKYLFQSKNPGRFLDLIRCFPENKVFATTIETNKIGLNDNAPPVFERQYWIGELSGDVMVTIEPIMDFDLNIMVNWIKDIEPKWVNIGADSKGHNLKEPPKEKIVKLISELKKFTKVNLKPNLKRLL